MEYTLDEWLAEFKPVTNHIDPTHGFDLLGDGCNLYETYGRELDYINQVSYRNVVWTVCEEDDMLYMVNGMRFVNRIGYVVTEENYCEDEIVFVSLGEDE